MQTVVACDGSSHRNGQNGPIGWAWGRDDGAWLGNGFYAGTNQRSELWALWSVLTFHPKGSLLIQMDSQYALNVAEKWAFGWEQKGWIKSDGKQVLNLDLVKPILKLRKERKDLIEFQWVKGHRKDNAYPLNTVADLRAGEASERAKSATDAETSLVLYRDSKGRTVMPQEAEMIKLIGAGLLK